MSNGDLQLAGKMPALPGSWFQLTSGFSRGLLSLSWLAFLVSTAPLRAHDPGLSALALRVDQGALQVVLTLTRVDLQAVIPLDANHDGRVGPEEFEKARRDLERLVFAGVVVSLNGVELKPAKASADLDPGDAVQVRLSFPLPSGDQLTVRSVLMQRLPRGHRQYVSLRDSEDHLLRDKMLDVKDALFEAQIARETAIAEPPGSFGQFVLLGVEHIATGYDHLVFLLGLMIVGGSFRAVLKIITSFTLAHSVTLALATVGMIRLPSSLIEPLIAASIMYVGLENVIRRNLDQRWVLTFVFGLIHGCGFASVLRDLGVGSSGLGVAVPLLSFNLGVELGQVTLAAIVLPIVWKLNQRAWFQPRYGAACSGLITLAGGCWLVQRLWLLARG